MTEQANDLAKLAPGVVMRTAEPAQFRVAAGASCSTDFRRQSRTGIEVAARGLERGLIRRVFLHSPFRPA